MRGARDRTAAVALTAIALLPLIVAVGTRAGRDYLPTGDIALMDLRIRDVWSRDIPLTGPYSRLGWNHPGPLPFWLMAPISGVTGRAAWGTQIAGVLLQGAAIVAIAWLSFRRRGLRFLAAVLAVVTLAYGAVGPSMLLEPWNPRVAFPFSILFLLLAWFVAEGNAQLLAPLAFVASVLVQSHVGYAPLVAVVVVVALVLLVWRTDAEPSFPVIATVGVLVICWAPVVAHEFTREHNIDRMADYFSERDGAIGARAAAGLYGEEFEPPPPWLGGQHRVDRFTDSAIPANETWVLVPLAALGAAAVLARRQRDADATTFIVLVGAATAAGLWSLARITSNPAGYLFYWRVPLALLTMFAVGLAMWRAFVRDNRTMARAATMILVGIVAVGGISTAIQVARAEPDGVEERAAHLILEQLRVPADERVLIRTTGSALFGLEATVVNELARDGVTVAVDPANAFRFGYHRDAALADVDQVWYVLEPGYLATQMLGQPGATLVASSSRLATAEELALQTLQRSLYDELVRAGRADLLDFLDDPLVGTALADIPNLDSDQIDALGLLNEKVRAVAPCRCAVIGFEPALADAALAATARD
ncbi:MAG: 6-pyruvoyl-tetrahydropterin synthase-related protein [Actinomycetota bacterium]